MLPSRCVLMCRKLKKPTGCRPGPAAIGTGWAVREFSLCTTLAPRVGSVVSTASAAAGVQNPIPWQMYETMATRASYDYDRRGVPSVQSVTRLACSGFEVADRCPHNLDFDSCSKPPHSFSLWADRICNSFK